LEPCVLQGPKARQRLAMGLEGVGRQRLGEALLGQEVPVVASAHAQR
jgi:hypothetical protein